MSELRRMATQLAVLQQLEKRVADARNALRIELRADMEPGDTKAATLDDGTPLGKVSLTTGAKRPKVTDERALLEWVREHRPDEVVESVRSSFVNAMKESAKEYGAAVVESTGEVVPGIELCESDPYVMVRPASGAGEAIESRWQEVLGELMPGGES